MWALLPQRTEVQGEQKMQWRSKPRGYVYSKYCRHWNAHRLLRFPSHVHSLQRSAVKGNSHINFSSQFSILNTHTSVLVTPLSLICKQDTKWPNHMDLEWKLSNTMELSPSWEAHTPSPSQETPSNLCQPQVCYHIDQNPPPVSILYQINPVHPLPPPQKRLTNFPVLTMHQ